MCRRNVYECFRDKTIKCYSAFYLAICMFEILGLDIPQNSWSSIWSPKWQPALAILVVFGTRCRQIFFSDRQNAVATNFIQPLDIHYVLEDSTCYIYAI